MGRPKSTKKKISVQEISVDQIIADDKNFNIGSGKGQQMIDKSFKKLGAGRSILIDKNNRNVAGNKSLEGFKNAGGKKVVIVEADRDTLIAVKRTDLDLDSKEGREMALSDNQSQATNFVLDIEAVNLVAEELDIDTGEWGIDSESASGKKKLKEEDIRPFKKTHILLSFPPEKMIDIVQHLEAIRKVEGVEYEQGSN